MDKIDQKKISRIVNLITEEYKDVTINKNMHPKMIAKVMEYVELMDGIAGKDKKNLVMFIFKEVSDKLTDEELDFELIGETIELIVSVARGEFNINKFRGFFGALRKYLVKKDFSCLKSCFK